MWEVKAKECPLRKKWAFTHKVLTATEAVAYTEACLEQGMLHITVTKVYDHEA